MGYKQHIIRLLRYLPPNIHVKANIVQLGPTELLKGRGALITGGAGGIGSAIAEAMVRAGAKVVLAGRNEEKLAEMCKKLNGGGEKAFSFVLDLSNVNAYEAAIEQAAQLLGETPLDLLVNNAGVMGTSYLQVTEASFDRLLATNVKAVYLLSHKMAKRMASLGLQGNILNLSSISGNYPAVQPYEVSKWSVNGITLGLARLLYKKGIVVNAIAPGYVATDMLGIDKSGDIGHRSNPIGRYIMPEEIANLAVFMTSGMGRCMIGSVVDMAGGSSVVEDDDVFEPYPW